MFYPPHSGGARTYLRAKSRWLREHTHWRHSVIAPRAQYVGSHVGNQTDDGSGSDVARGVDSRLAATADADEPELIALPSLPVPWNRSFRWPLSTAAATRCLLALTPQLIEAGDPYQCAWSALQARDRLRIPALIFHHSDLPNLAEERFGGIARIAAERYLQRLYREFDSVLAPSAATAASLRALGLPHVVQQPLGVNTRWFSPHRRDAGLRARLAISEQTCLLVYAGRFSREKNLANLIEAVQQLGSGVHLLLIGAGRLPSTTAQVSVIPYQRSEAALAALLSACDLFVHPGAHETFGLVALEAMACGLPVLGVRSGGVAELIDEDIGWLVEDGSADALAEGLRSLRRRDLPALGRAARQRACSRHDWQCVLPQLVAHYRQLASAGPAAARSPQLVAR